jgi:hypothetical protein
LARLEREIQQLSYDEQLWLIERLVHGLRQRARNVRPAFDAALAEMAADPEIRRELEEISREFAVTEMDGLEQR